MFPIDKLKFNKIEEPIYRIMNIHKEASQVWNSSFRRFFFKVSSKKILFFGSKIGINKLAKFTSQKVLLYI
jgi:hypothetical protein